MLRHLPPPSFCSSCHCFTPPQLFQPSLHEPEGPLASAEVTLLQQPFSQSRMDHHISWYLLCTWGWKCCRLFIRISQHWGVILYRHSLRQLHFRSVILVHFAKPSLTLIHHLLPSKLEYFSYIQPWVISQWLIIMYMSPLKWRGDLPRKPDACTSRQLVWTPSFQSQHKQGLQHY